MIRILINKKYVGFTLTEILLTLVIIGVVCAMTIPNLMNNTHSYENIQAWKKSYSEVSNAFNLALKDNVSLDYPTSGWYGFSSDTVNTILSYMNLDMACSTDSKSVEMGFTDPTCTEDDKINWSNYKSLSGRTFSFSGMTRKIARLQNGAVLYIGGDWQPIWGIDINGPKKGPNVIGKDTFGVVFTKNWMRPIGALGTPEVNTPHYGSSGCFEDYYDDVYNDSIYLPRAAGSGCSYKYIQEK